MELLEKKRNVFIVFLMILALGLGLRIYSGLHKAYFFHDGIFTLELINDSEWARERTNEDNYNKLISGSVFLEDMRISDDEKFNYEFNDVLKYEDIHPPLYYWILHPFQVMISDGEVSWWPGLILNFIFYVLSSIVLYKLVFLFNKSCFFSLFPVAFFSVSPAMISSDMIVRMYSAFGFFSLWFIYESFLFYKGEKGVRNSVTLFLSCLLGALTHHYFLCLALFVFLTLSYGYLYKRSYKECRQYFSVLSLSAVAYLIIWPVVFQQVFYSKLSSSIVSRIGTMTTLEELFSMTNYYLFSGLFYCFFAVLLFLILSNVDKLRGFKIFKEFGFCYFSFFIVTALMFIVVYITQPFDIMDGSYRYFYVPNLLLIGLFGIFLSSLVYVLNVSMGVKVIFSFFLMVVFFLNFNLKKVEYLFPENYSKGSVLNHFMKDDVPVIVKLRDDWNSSIFDDSQKDWVVVNVMPYLHNKSNIYIISESWFNSDSLDEVISLIDLERGDDFYVVSTRQSKFIELLSDKFGEPVEKQRIRYNWLFKFHL